MENIFQLLAASAARTPDRIAIVDGETAISYEQLLALSQRVRSAIVGLGLSKLDRIAIFLDKRLETVAAIFGAVQAGVVFVPVNPQLKPHQVRHVVGDSGAKVLITTAARYQSLHAVLGDMTLEIVLCDQARPSGVPANDRHTRHLWRDLVGAPAEDKPGWRTIEQDPAAILYTSGSTGAPKGIVLSHGNLRAGALSVNEYLGNSASDVILSLLPLSFDAGLSQLTTAIAAGARLVLHNYLRPQEVVQVCRREHVTSLTAVPPLWMQLTTVEWTAAAAERLRLFANTGGHMPRDLLQKLRAIFVNAKPYLMYGLTEAFRSTYLPPEQVDRRPDSIGKAVPNAEIHVLRPDGAPCDADEPGELVHRGAFVALGYWNDPERTALRFRPFPALLPGIPPRDLAVWSGDTVRRDREGFLYFIGRTDEMIKTSGYRVSPTEVEEVLFNSALVGEVAVAGVPHPALGQAIIAFVVAADQPLDRAVLSAHCRRHLPTYMLPSLIVELDELPRNMNGKIDRKALAAQHASSLAHDAPKESGTVEPIRAQRIEAPAHAGHAAE
jgi:acyl-CoA ligase (AMP-forming) (exosortase A-associated)